MGASLPVLDTMREDPVAWLALLASFVSPLILYVIYRLNNRRVASHDYLQAATRLLEQAYDAFRTSASDRWNGLPEPDRRLWLTVARMLTEAEATANHITESSHVTLYGQAKDYWRGQFFDLLLPLKSAPLTYFSESADAIVAVHGNQRMALAVPSLRVVMDFKAWPEGKPDPIAEAARFSDHEVDRIRSFESQGLADFLKASNDMYSSDDRLRDFWRRKWHDANGATE